MTARAWGGALVGLAVAAGCSGDPIDAGAPDVDAGVVSDPLVGLDVAPAAGSLDDIQQNIISPRCSGEPGLCHNGQFEPNLSTAANTYAYIVDAPASENRTRLRVEPGDPDRSFLIDKLRNRDVLTQMPLGAEPLTEDEIQSIEDWISSGALRRPGALPAPTLNNAPLPPEIGVYHDDDRIDTAGTFEVPKGQPITIRHSVSDFETADADVPFGVVIVTAADGRNLELAPGTDDPANGVSEFDPAGPMGNGDLLNFKFDLTIGDTVTLVGEDGTRTEGVSVEGLSFAINVLYVDEFPDGILTLTLGQNRFEVE